MSYFRYGNHTPKHIGVWLRYRSNQDIINLVKESKLKRFYEVVERVIVAEYDDSKNQVWLEVWCRNPIDTLRDKHRHNVFSIKVDINPAWICEGDLGAGLHINKLGK